MIIVYILMWMLSIFFLSQSIPDKNLIHRRSFKEGDLIGINLVIDSIVLSDITISQNFQTIG